MVNENPRNCNCSVEIMIRVIFQLPAMEIRFQSLCRLCDIASLWTQYKRKQMPRSCVISRDGAAGCGKVCSGGDCLLTIVLLTLIMIAVRWDSATYIGFKRSFISIFGSGVHLPKA